MPHRGGLVGLHEHPSPTVWKSQIQKSSENTLSGVIWRDVVRERHAIKKQTQKFLGLINEESCKRCVVA